jgi:hypothetical protein
MELVLAPPVSRAAAHRSEPAARSTDGVVAPPVTAEPAARARSVPALKHFT